MNETNNVEPKVNQHPFWKVPLVERVSACDNRPGLKKIYVKIIDAQGLPMPDVKVRFDTEPSRGIAYDHQNVYGLTDEDGYLEWEHLGKPTRYRLFMQEDIGPLIENIRTDLGNEYCKPPGSWFWQGNIAVNKPGVYSYRLEIQWRG